MPEMRRSVSKEEIVAGIRECAQQLGRTPYFEDFQQFKGIKETPVLNAFGSWGRALRAAGMEPRGTYGKLSKGAILTAIQECAEALGRVPTHAEFKHKTGITQYNVIGMFGSWSKALKACGMKPHQGSAVSIETHFKAWAELVRKNGQFPTTVEYAFEARHSARSLRHRVGTWSGVPQGLPITR
jgi:HNH endonuclease